jgi:poly(A) polymerase/tRNA nucleotidyltransferase (CCA-adding enzyme)
MNYKIPKEVLEVLERLESAGFEAYLVGGCVRDLLLARTPKDWDVTTNAVPEEIQKAFDNTFYENDFGTVGVVTASTEPSLKVVEVTPYRREAKYSDKRHPDIVHFAKKLEDDLQRRDFTANAMALRISQAAYLYSEEDGQKSVLETGDVDEKFVEIVDLWEGRKDLEKKIIRTVGNPSDRFNEDALRILRAVRLAAELNFSIDKTTNEAVKDCAHLLKMISKERIRDEFSKILMSEIPDSSIREMQKLGILRLIAPELEEGIDITQNKEHVYTVWEHNLRSLKHSAEKKFPLEVRIASLLHDIGKPRTKMGEGPDSTFYNHEVVSARMAAQILSRLRYPKKFIEKVVRLVRWHLFFSDTDVITLSAVRRLVRNVGPENVWDLMSVRFCDRIGMGRPKEQPYRLRKYEAMIEEALRDPIRVSQLKVDGRKVMEIAGIAPSPKVGYILHSLLMEVLDDPSLNTSEYLKKRIGELAKLSEKEVEALGSAGKERREEEEKKEVSKIRKKYGVR